MQHNNARNIVANGNDSETKQEPYHPTPNITRTPGYPYHATWGRHPSVRTVLTPPCNRISRPSQLSPKVSTTTRISAAPLPEAPGPYTTSMATNLVMPFKLVTTNFVMRCSEKVGTVWKSTLDKFEKNHMCGWRVGVQQLGMILIPTEFNLNLNLDLNQSAVVVAAG